MHTRFGPLGLTLMFSFAMVAAPIGVGIDSNTITIKESAAYAAKGGNKGGNSATHRSSRSSGGSKSSASSSSSRGSDTSTSRRGGRSSGTSVSSNGSRNKAGSNKKVFTNADGTERAHPSVLGRLNAWLNANENAIQNASLNSTMGMARVYQETRAEASAVVSDAEAALSEAEQAVVDAVAALEGGAENIALAEEDLEKAIADADLAAQALTDAQEVALALEAEFNGTKFDDEEAEAEAQAELNAAIEALEVDKLLTDVEDTEQSVVDAQVAVDEAVEDAAKAQAVVENAETELTTAESDLADAQLEADSLNALADQTLEDAANKELTDEVRDTVDSFFGVKVASEDVVTEEVIVTD